MSAALQYAPGTVLLGKYRIERVLGEGGMGIVVLAMHLQLEERVALKFLLPEVMSNAEVVQRFLREAQAAVKLKGEHVARVIDVGTLEGGVPYMVMEYLEGGDLSQLLDSQGSIEPAIAVDYALQACEALAEAHSLGIVHRDIKPANFFLTRRPDGSALLKMLDFGISKATTRVEQSITRTQAVMGTPAYMSPEQMRSSRDVDGRSDVWSLGVVLYELLGGRRPFQSETFSELCIQVAVDPVPPLQYPGPPELAATVARCLEKDITARVQNVAELAGLLAPFASNPGQAQVVAERCARMLGLASTTRTSVLPGAIMPASPLATPTSISGSAGQVMSTTPTRGPSWGRAALIVGGLGVAVAVTLVLVLGTGGESSSQPDPAGSDPRATSAEKASQPPAPSAAAAAAIDAGMPTKTATTAAVPPSGDAEAESVPAPDAGAPAMAKSKSPTKSRRSSARRKKSPSTDKPRSRPTDEDDEDLLGNRY